MMCRFNQVKAPSMKNKLLLVFLLFALTSSDSSAQSFLKGQKDLNIGLGLGNRFVGRGYSRSLPAFNLSLDYGITDEISLGAYFGYSAATYEYQLYRQCGNGNFGYYNDVYHWTFYILGVRGAYHFAKLIPEEKLDLYAGLFLGNAFGRYTFSSNDPCGSKGFYGNDYLGGVVFAGFLGARYRFTDNLGAFCELGYGLSYLTLGLNLKF
jgi:hypothetical protein